MSPEEKATIKANLLKELEKVQSRIADLKELTRPISPENAIGRVSRMDAINNKSVNEATLRTAESKFSNIKLALEKIDEPDFGICRICGQDIPYGRLIVMPGSSRCVRCAQR